jgi:hypothetical protein
VQIADSGQHAAQPSTTQHKLIGTTPAQKNDNCLRYINCCTCLLHH